MRHDIAWHGHAVLPRRANGEGEKSKAQAKKEEEERKRQVGGSARCFGQGVSGKVFRARCFVFWEGLGKAARARQGPWSIFGMHTH